MNSKSKIVVPEQKQPIIGSGMSQRTGNAKSKNQYDKEMDPNEALIA